jgi:hypothetical protein
MMFVCPRCGNTSYHETDEQEGYCVSCNDYTGMERARVAELPMLTGEELIALGAAVSKEIQGLNQVIDVIASTPKVKDAVAHKKKVLFSLLTAIQEAQHRLH